MIIPIACRTQDGAQRLLSAIKARAFQAATLAPALKKCAAPPLLALWARRLICSA